MAIEEDDGQEFEQNCGDDEPMLVGRLPEENNEPNQAADEQDEVEEEHGPAVEDIGFTLLTDGFDGI
jgi:hypothetical protein